VPGGSTAAMTTLLTTLPHRGKKPWEDLCCMARCRRETTEQVAVRYGGREREVGMCAEHAPAYRELARR